MKCLVFVSLVFTLLNVNCSEISTEKGKLIFATVVYRHGDRTPIKSYSTDPWNSTEFWAEKEWGKLTQIGIRQQYNLGLWLRKRYLGSVVQETYLDRDIYVTSSNLDRTIMSAAANLAGLYQPTGSQIWNEEILWQPIPIHTIPKSMDTILRTSRPCPAYNHYYNELMKSHEFQRLERKYKDLYRYLSVKTGNPINNIWDIMDLYDTFYVETTHGMKLPDWAETLFRQDDMLSITKFAFKVDTFTPQMARIKHGVLLKEILDRFTNKTKGLLKPDRSMWMYSGHDTTLSGLLNLMGMFELHFPAYATCLMFELRQNYLNQPYVEIFYKNYTDSDVAEKLMIPHCGYSCPLESMYKLYAASMPIRDRDVECRWSQDRKDRISMQISSASAKAVTSIAVLLILLFIN